MRMPQHDVRNEGYGPYVMFYCEKCQREYHSTAKVVNTVAQDTAKSVFGGLLRNIPVVGDAVADSVDNNADRYRTSMTDQELNVAWEEVQRNFRECPTCHMVVCIPDFDEVSGYCRDDSPRGQEIAQAQAEQARAQMALAQEQLSRASVRAPFAGIVAKGDLSQSLGSSVRRGDTLFEITPLDAYRVIVQVDEGEITGVRAGQKGTLLLASMANDGVGLTVTSVTPVTTSREGRNFFRVEARLDGTSDRLRPGMEGVAKIDIDERKLIWIWTHKALDWLRLFIWTWWP